MRRRPRLSASAARTLLAQLTAASLALFLAAGLLVDFADAAPSKGGAVVAKGDGKDKGGGVGSGGLGGGVGGGGAIDVDPEAPKLGTYNPLVIDNPICHESLAQAQRRNCESTGAPEARWPASNYGLEIHVDTGLDNIVGNFQAMLAQIANAIWQLALFVLGLVLALLGWAFGLNPFADNAVLSDLDAGLERFYRAFSAPWLIAGFVALGAWAVYRGLFLREISATVGGLVLSVALMLLALAILHNPAGTVGEATRIVNRASTAVIAAPQQGGISNPTGSYARATEQVWEAMTLPGFIALNFSDADWALQKPDPELLALADRYACEDLVFGKLVSNEKWRQILAGDLDEGACEEIVAAARKPRSNAEIYLRSSPGSRARDELWQEFADELPYQQYLAIQGGGGAWVRLPLVLLIGLGLLGGIALIAWLALRIFVQTAVAFVLVMSAPLALFMPAFGERGRGAFALWGTTLVGAIASKLVYSALLSVVIFGTTTLGGLVRGGGGIGAFMAFLVMAGFWWAVLLKRDDLLRFVSVGGEEGGSSRLGRMAGVAGSAYLGRQAVGAVGAMLPGAGGPSRGADTGRAGLIGSREDRAEGGRRVAEKQLQRSADRYLDHRYKASQQAIVSPGGGRAGGGGEAAAAAQAANGPRAQGSGSGSPGGDVAAEAAAQSAVRFVGEADARQQATGSRWGAEQRAQAVEALRHQANRPLEDPAHAWRLGRSPQEYGELKGRERIDAHNEVREQLKADKLALGTIPDRPGGAPSAGASRRYRRHQRWRPGGAGRLAAGRRQAWQERRQPRPRRGISR